MITRANYRIIDVSEAAGEPAFVSHVYLGTYERTIALGSIQPSRAESFTELQIAFPHTELIEEASA